MIGFRPVWILIAWFFLLRWVRFPFVVLLIVLLTLLLSCRIVILRRGTATTCWNCTRSCRTRCSIKAFFGVIPRVAIWFSVFGGSAIRWIPPPAAIAKRVFTLTRLLLGPPPALVPALPPAVLPEVGPR